MIFAVLDPSPLTVCINCSFFPVIADIAIFVLKRDDKLQLTDNCSGLTQRGQDMARRNENVFLMQQITDNLHASEIIQSSSLRKLPL